MKEGRMQIIGFSDTCNYGVRPRPLTFKEYLILCEYAKQYPDKYGDLHRW